MKFLCLGYFQPEKMDARPAAEMSALMQECGRRLASFYGSGAVRLDAGLEMQTTRLARAGGQLRVTDGPFTESKEVIGSVFVIEAASREEAIQLAALHPSLQMDEGEALGWRVELRPIHHFKGDGAASG